MRDVPFQLVADYAPAGDQPKAIKALLTGLRQGDAAQTLLGVTGSGKTFTMANVIQALNRPTLVLAHNKTLAAQLYNELQAFFPNNAVEYFISYYDYYQPEAYIPRTDTYIEKSAVINEEIDRMRHSATRNLFERRDVIVVASVSCIYGLGLPDNYLNAAIRLQVGMTLERDLLLTELVRIQYQRFDQQSSDLQRSTFRVRGDTIELRPAYEESILRLTFFDEELESIIILDPATGQKLETPEELVIYPAIHYVADRDDLERAMAEIKVELLQRLNELTAANKLIEAQRLEQRVLRDLAMIRELGYCPGIENYSRIFENRPPGTPPKTLIDYFSKDFLLFIDESHVTLPQLRGMFHGDRSRKDTLVDYGFRLPCARDNRPLNFDEFLARIGQRVFVSATPSAYELGESSQVIEQIIRPTGLLDPEIDVRPTANQVDDLLSEIQQRVQKNERVLVTTLTKRMAEDLSEYFESLNVKVRYLHSDIKPLERVEILQDLRLGNFDVLIGVNLLREGLDLPEVSLVAIMDADKEGFLRSEQSLIQTIGRAARNACGQVIMYADTVTESMNRAIQETQRRRAKQLAFNQTHGITPKTIQKALNNNLLTMLGGDNADVSSSASPESKSAQVRAQKQQQKQLEEEARALAPEKLESLLHELEAGMKAAAQMLAFEKAAQLRDQWQTLKRILEKAE